MLPDRRDQDRIRCGTAYQTEWATDILFKSPAALAAVYPGLVQHAMHHFKSPDVMRFLGKKVSGNFLGEITTSFKVTVQGPERSPDFDRLAGQK